MERLLTGLVDFTIKKVISLKPERLEALYKRETSCPECGCLEKRIKASFWRDRVPTTETLGHALDLSP